MAWKEPKLGELNARIRIDRLVETPDGIGGFETGWTALFTTSARLSPTRGGEEIRADRQLGIENVEITIPASKAAKTVTNGDRAVDVRTGKTFNIGWADDLSGGQRYILITAQSGGLTDG